MAVWIAARDPRVPWYAKALAGATAAYALSPLDLIPDFIPVIGYVDDVIIVPAFEIRTPLPASTVAAHGNADSVPFTAESLRAIESRTADL